MNKNLNAIFFEVAVLALANGAFAATATVPAYGNLTGTCTTSSLICLNSLTIPAGTSIASVGSGIALTTTAGSASSGTCTTAPSGWDGASGAGLISGANAPIAGLNLNPAGCSITGTPTVTTKGTQTVAIRNQVTSTDNPAYTSFWLTVK